MEKDYLPELHNMNPERGIGSEEDTVVMTREDIEDSEKDPDTAAFNTAESLLSAISKKHGAEFGASAPEKLTSSTGKEMLIQHDMSSGHFYVIENVPGEARFIGTVDDVDGARAFALSQ